MTEFLETEALLLAFEAQNIDGRAALDKYLREHFLPGELDRLLDAAVILADRCGIVRRNRTDT